MSEITREVSAQEIGKPQPFMTPTNFADMMLLANTLAKSDIIPTSFKGRPENVLIAIGMGQEVGLNPFQALQSIMVVNGRPSLWGDAVIGIVQASGLMEYCEETMDEKQTMATCKVKRRGDPVEVSRSFSMIEAKQAGLTAKPGPWQQYPKRMLQMRARSWALRDKFSDLLRGLKIREEMEDIVETDQVDDVPMRKSEIHAGPVSSAGEPPSTGAMKQEPKGPELVSSEDRKGIAAIAADRGWTTEGMKDLLARRYSIASSKDLPKDKLADLKDILVNGESAPEPEAA